LERRFATAVFVAAGGGTERGGDAGAPLPGGPRPDIVAAKRGRAAMADEILTVEDRRAAPNG